MLYHKQLIMHDPANGKYGDCARTSLACLLDLPIEDVPHFMEDNPTSEEFLRRVTDWLASKNLQDFAVPFRESQETILLTMAALNPDIIYRLVGQSVRGVNHVVICRGGEVIHDPHPSNAGLCNPTEDGYYWVEVLVPKILA